MIETIAEQAREPAFAGPHTATKPRVLLRQLLAEITPGDLNHFLYTSGGAEAIKIARGYTGRHKILSRYRSCHGANYGAVAATGDPRRWVLTLIYPMLSYENMSLTFVQARGRQCSRGMRSVKSY